MMEGLDEKLTPIESPISDNQGAVTPSEFTSDNERNAVGNFNLKNFNFSKGSGGTLVLGGTLNGQGLMQLRDGNGSLIMQQDYLGQHFYNTVGTESIRVDLTGFHAYGSTGGTELVRVDNIGFHAYGTQGTSTELIKVDRNGLHGFIPGGTETINVGPTGINTYGQNGDTFRFYNTVGGTQFGIMGYGDSSNQFIFAAQNGAKLTLGNLSGNIDVVASGTLSLNGTVVEINGSPKSAIVPTSKGYKTLFTNESPDVWFMDICDSKDKIDPLFIETIEKVDHFVKVEDIDGRVKYQVWGIRKGMSKKRFEPKTEEQFKKNNIFWNTPNR